MRGHETSKCLVSKAFRVFLRRCDTMRNAAESVPLSASFIATRFGGLTTDRAQARFRVYGGSVGPSRR